MDIKFIIKQLENGIIECDKNIDIFKKQIDIQENKKKDLQIELEIIKRKM